METNNILIIAAVLSGIAFIAEVILFRKKMKRKPKAGASKFYVIYFVVALTVLVLLLLFLRNGFSEFMADME